MSFVISEAIEDNRDSSECSSLTPLSSEPSGITLSDSSAVDCEQDPDGVEEPPPPAVEDEAHSSDDGFIVSDRESVQMMDDAEDEDADDERSATLTTSASDGSALSLPTEELSVASLQRRGRLRVPGAPLRRSARIQALEAERTRRRDEWLRRMSELADDSPVESGNAPSVHTVADSSDDHVPVQAKLEDAKGKVRRQASVEQPMPKYIEFEHDGMLKRVLPTGLVFVKHATGWLRESSLHHERLMASYTTASAVASSSRMTLDDPVPVARDRAHSASERPASLSPVPTFATPAGHQPMPSPDPQLPYRDETFVVATYDKDNHPFPSILMYDSSE